MILVYIGFEDEEILVDDFWNVYVYIFRSVGL